jgi:hypothetical protein
LHEDDKGDEAVVEVVSGRRGGDQSGGAMTERVVAVGVLVDKKKRGKRRREEGKELGFAGTRWGFKGEGKRADGGGRGVAWWCGDVVHGRVTPPACEEDDREGRIFSPRRGTGQEGVGWVRRRGGLLRWRKVGSLVRKREGPGGEEPREVARVFLFFSFSCFYLKTFEFKLFSVLNLKQR